MRRQRPLRAEILGCGHNPPAKEDLPEAIHRDSCGQRITGIGKPTGQAEPVARRILGKWIQRGGGLPANRPVPRRVVGAARQDIGLARLRQLLHGHDVEDVGLVGEQPLVGLAKLFACFECVGIQGAKVVRPQRCLVFARDCLGQRLAVVDLCNFDGGQGSRVDPEFIDEGILDARGAKAGAKRKAVLSAEVGRSAAGLHILREMVAHDLGPGRFAVDINMQARCPARGLMADRDLHPCICRKSRLRADGRGITRPEAHLREQQLSILERQLGSMKAGVGAALAVKDHAVLEHGRNA